MSLTQILYNNEMLFTAVAAILAFVTIISLGAPLLSRDNLAKRMRYVAARRGELQAKRRAELSGRRSGLRAEAVGTKKVMKDIVEDFNLVKLVEPEKARVQLVRAGFRSPMSLTIYIFCRSVLPFLLLIVALVYFFLVANISWTAMQKLAAALSLAVFGLYAPGMYVANVASKRGEAIMASFPDALDLLLICVESGMSAELAFQRVASEIAATAPVLAEEFEYTTAELSYLPDRRQAFENLSNRCAYEGVRSVATALSQAEKYGTTLGQALRVCAAENRQMRMAVAEKKAAALPAKLSVPMILFFLPCLFIVIMSPAMMQISHVMHGG